MNLMIKSCIAEEAASWKLKFVGATNGAAKERIVVFSFCLLGFSGA
jgi:hypothetical protein